MAALPALITVEMFRHLPADKGEYVHELHHGEIVRMTRPKFNHHSLQRKLERLLQAKFEEFGQVDRELAYRPLPEFELRVADVAVVSQPRYDSIDAYDNLRGAPEIVIEVKSPSNREGKLTELASLCLANGSVEFWVIDLDRKSVTVVRRDGQTDVYSAGDCIPLTLAGAASLPVSAIFA